MKQHVTTISPAWNAADRFYSNAGIRLAGTESPTGFTEKARQTT